MIGTIGEHADVIAPSALAHYHITDSYTNLTGFDGKEFGVTRLDCAIAYGSFRLVFVVLGNIFAPDALEQFVKHFAELMLRLTAGAIIGTHSILAFRAGASFWITMVLVENAQRPALVN